MCVNLEVIRSHGYTFCRGLILLNAVVIGLETDFPEKFAWDVVENIFLAFFSVELAAWLQVWR